MTREQLYPHIEAFETSRLSLDGRHVMYWEQSGRPDGVPVVFLHGGPGAGAIPVHRRFFDPDFYRIVVHDQRGAGRSTPRGELADNTTDHLIADMERLRELLGIEKWLLSSITDLLPAASLKKSQRGQLDAARSMASLPVTLVAGNLHYLELWPDSKKGIAVKFT